VNRRIGTGYGTAADTGFKGMAMLSILEEQKQKM